MSSTTTDKSYTDLLYHFTKNNNGVPIYPYVAAVTGHRSFAQPGEAEGIPGFTEQDIKKAFISQLRPMAELWRKSCGNANAPFILLTGMADGADQIAADAATELVEHEPELNIKIVAVLPMPEDVYIKTIENQKRFTDLLEKAIYKIVIPWANDNIGHESELARICNETEFRRQKQYVLQSRFLALHSHVLFAFWDGIPSTQNKGGTADTVFFKLNNKIVDDNETQQQGDILTFSPVGPVVHLLIPRDDANGDNLAFSLDENLDMSSIPVLYWTRDKKRKLEYTLEFNKWKKARAQAKKQAASDGNSEADDAKHLIELKYSQWFNNCDPLVAISKLDFRKDLMNSELLCKTAVADQKDIKDVLTKIGTINHFSVHQFRPRSCITLFLYYVWKFICEKIFNRIRKRQINCDTFLKKCKTESYNWLFGIYDDQDYLIPQNASGNEVKFSNLFGELRPWEDRNTRLLVEHYVLADQMAMKYQTEKMFILIFYSCFFSLLSAIIFCLSFYDWGTVLKSIIISINGSEQSLMQISGSLFSPSFFFLIFSLLLCYVFCIIFLNKRQYLHDRYHRFRALAETLRIQIFWRISGIDDSVSAYYRSHQIQEAEWIRAVIYGLDAILTPPKDSGFNASQEERIQFTIDNWVTMHRNYFFTKEMINKKVENQKEGKTLYSHPYAQFIPSLFILALPVINNIANELWLYFRLDQYINNIYFVTIGLLVVYAIFRINARRALKAETIIHFEQILIPFERAALLLNSPRPVEEQKMIIRQLGMQTISENSNWLLTNGKQELTQPPLTTPQIR